tara:strand:- start:387 stop:1001 length:615 start_codon:yes stop_codon:yes gene_type:complete
MATFDKEYLESIISIEHVKDNLYVATLASGKTDEHILKKSQFEAISRSLKSKSDVQRNQLVTEANTASETRFNSGIDSARKSPSKKVGRKSWQPAAVTNISGKKDEYAYRLVNTEVPGNVSKKMAEGWEYCSDEGVNTPGITLQDGSQIGSAKQIRESLLMRMPKETKEARDRYFSDQQKSAGEREAEARRAIGDTAYGEVRIS